MKTLMIGLMAWGVAGAAQAQDWVVGGVSRDAVQIYDQSGVRTSGDLRSVWIVTIFKARQSEHVQFDYTATRSTIDCFNMRTKYTSMRLYQMDNQEPSESFDEEGEWFGLNPNSIGETTATMVCSGETHEIFGKGSFHALAPGLRQGLRDFERDRP